MIFDCLVIAIFCYAALAWGSNEPWAMALLSASSLAALAGKWIWDIWRSRLRLYGSWALVPIILFLVLIGWQSLNVFPVLEPVSSWLPHTIAIQPTMLYLLLALGYFALGLLVINGFQSREDAKRLILLFLGLGVLEALYGLVQHLGDYNYVWNYEVSSDIARGTFVNRNHYALLLNLMLCTGVGYLYYRSVRLLRGQNLTLRHVLSAPGSAQLAWVILWLSLIGLALIMSMSRMGIIALFGSLGIMLIAGKMAERGRRTTVLATSLLFAILGLALYTGLDTVLARYEAMAQAGYLEKDRIPIWREAWKMIRQYPAVGQGIGTFQYTFPAFEKYEPDTPARYAHNDYVQAAAEVGFSGIFLLVCAFVACWKTATANLFRSADPLVRGVGLATLGMLTAAALQEMTDFSLYIPGVAAGFTVLMGLNLRTSLLRKEEEQARHSRD